MFPEQAPTIETSAQIFGSLCHAVQAKYPDFVCWQTLVSVMQNNDLDKLFGQSGIAVMIFPLTNEPGHVGWQIGDTIISVPRTNTAPSHIGTCTDQTYYDEYFKQNEIVPVSTQPQSLAKIATFLHSINDGTFDSLRQVKPITDEELNITTQSLIRLAPLINGIANDQNITSKARQEVLFNYIYYQQEVANRLIIRGWNVTPLLENMIGNPGEVLNGGKNFLHWWETVKNALILEYNESLQPPPDAMFIRHVTNAFLQQRTRVRSFQQFALAYIERCTEAALNNRELMTLLDIDLSTWTQFVETYKQTIDQFIHTETDAIINRQIQPLGPDDIRDFRTEVLPEKVPLSKQTIQPQVANPIHLGIDANFNDRSGEYDTWQKAIQKAFTIHNPLKIVFNERINHEGVNFSELVQKTDWTSDLGRQQFFYTLFQICDFLDCHQAIGWTFDQSFDQHIWFIQNPETSLYDLRVSPDVPKVEAQQSRYVARSFRDIMANLLPSYPWISLTVDVLKKRNFSVGDQRLKQLGLESALNEIGFPPSDSIYNPNSYAILTRNHFEHLARYIYKLMKELSYPLPLSLAEQTASAGLIQDALLSKHK